MERFHGMAHRRERTVILAALFIALSVALGFLLAGIPNLELMTLTVFMAGSFCGARLGGAIGALSILIFSLLNPLGPAPAPASRRAGRGFRPHRFGRRDRRAAHRCRPARPASAASAAAGFVLTLAYDALTTVATAFIALGASRFIEGLRGVAVAGIVFVAWHVGDQYRRIRRGRAAAHESGARMAGRRGRMRRTLLALVFVLLVAAAAQAGGASRLDRGGFAPHADRGIRPDARGSHRAEHSYPRRYPPAASGSLAVARGSAWCGRGFLDRRAEPAAA